MDPFLFIVDRYNYWIFIVLMMVGLYTVIARGNLVKKIIGLNIFQTSVFIYYISIGKIAGGTAPIYTYEHQKTLFKDSHGGDHHGETGDGHSDAHSDGHSTETPGEHEGDHSDEAGGDHADGHSGEPSGDHGGTEVIAGGSHGGDIGGIDTGFIEPIYSNPLPHVLILTAIVVGVATTSVGLALAVRIREAYGTIEEDEVEAADNIAEFGVEDPREEADPGDSGSGDDTSSGQRGSMKLSGDRLAERLGRRLGPKPRGAS